jgi:hypothetical protein
MKKIIFLMVMLGVTLYASADYKLTKEDLDHFYKTKTLVVIEENPLLSYNAYIKQLIPQEWTITPYEFITVKEFEEKRNDPKYSFLIMTSVTFDKDKIQARYKFLQVLLGGDYFRVNEMPEICSVPLAYEGVDEESYVYKLGVFIRFIQNHINSLNQNNDLIGDDLFKFYSKSKGDVQSKTLYLIADELSKDVNTEKRIKAVYHHKFKIVTRQEVEDAIENKDSTVVFLHKVGPEGTRLVARCYKIIVGAADAKFYYFDYHKISDDKPDGLLKDDFKDLDKKK